MQMVLTKPRQSRDSLVQFLSADRVSWNECTVSGTVNAFGATSYYVNLLSGTFPTSGQQIYISFSPPPATSDIPLTSGDVLQWNDLDQKFKPAQLPDLDTKRIQDMDDFTFLPGPDTLSEFSTSFADGQAQPSESPTGSTNPGTGGVDGGAYVNNNASSSHFKVSNVLDVAVDSDEVWDVFAIAFRSTTQIDTNNRIWLAGNKDQAHFSGWAIYTKESGISWHYDNTHTEFGSVSFPLAADTWHTALIQLHWATGRSNAPNIQVWIDGTAVNSDETSVPAAASPDASDDWFFSSNSTLSADFDHLAYRSSSQEMFSPTQASIDWFAAYDTLTEGSAPLVDGDTLQWVNASRRFKPRAAQRRSQPSVTAAAVASGAEADVLLPNTGLAGSFMSVTVSKPSWVRFYADTASRAADAGRLQTVSPDPGSGVLLEVITTSDDEVIMITPALGYFNNDGVDGLPIRISNSGATPFDITVEAKVLPLEY